MASVNGKIRARPLAVFSDEEFIDYLNREVSPTVRELVDELNRISGDAVETAESMHVLLRHSVLIGDATSGEVIFTLPSAAAAKGKWFWAKKIDAVANDVKLASTDLLDGSTTLALSSQYDKAVVYCDGSTYHVL